MKPFPFSELVGAAICVVLGSLVAGAEAALVSLPESRVRAMHDELGPSRRRQLERYLADPTTVLSRLLAFRVTALIVAAILAANALLMARAPWWQLTALTIAIALGYGTIAEVSMTLGRARGRAIAPIALSLTRPFEILITPIAAPLILLGRATQKRLAARHSDEPPVTEREVEYVVEEAESTGGLDKKRGQMLQRVLELKDVTAREVMVPRTRMHAIEAATPIDRVLALVTEEGHSRIPVYRGQIDNVVGVLHVKDLYRAMQKSGDRSSVTLESIVRKPPFLVAASQSALAVLRDMQARRTHMAMVVDEYGAVIGLVTLEDILEELVGDIQDEHDTDEAPIVDQGDGRFLVSAAVPITELGEQLGVEFPDVQTYASLGGFLAERAGRVPSVGTEVEWNGLRFVVREGDNRHATKVEVVRQRPPRDKLAESAHAAE